MPLGQFHPEKSAPPAVGFITHPSLVDHITPAGHPESPDRLRAIASAVRASGLLTSRNPFAPVSIHFGSFPAIATPMVELPDPHVADIRWVQAVHPQEHIERIHNLSVAGGGMIDEDTCVSPESYDAALLAVGAVLSGCDAVMQQRVRRVFCAIRPPGHHAEANKAMGFCLFANVAIAARYLQQQYHLSRVAIVDFDVHHGNGTQAIFYNDPSVLFISVHENPALCYPGTGFESETGEGPAVGCTLNIAVESGAGDQDYLDIFRKRILPALNQFKPEAILLSAGFDAHQDDPLAHVRVSEDGYFMMARLLAKCADQICDGRIVSVLEGGYNLLSLGRSVVFHLLGLGAGSET